MPLHRLLNRQLDKASKEDGSVDCELFLNLISEAYENNEQANRRNERAMSLVSDEMMSKNAELEEYRQNLEILVEQQTRELRAAKEKAEKTEAEARIKSSFLSSIIDNAVDGLITLDGAGLIQTFNPSAELIFRYRRTEVINKNVSLLMRDSAFGGVDTYLKKIGDASSAGLSSEVIGKRKNGEEFPLDLALNEVLLDDGGRMFIATLRDISRRKEVEERLKSTTERMGYVLDYITEGIYGLDLNGYTTFSNKAAVDMLGYSLEEMLNKSQHALIHHHYADGTPYPRDLCNIYHAFRDGKVHKEENEVFWHKDGSSFPIEYNSSPTRDEGGRITGAVVVFRDITERKKAEQRLQEYAALMEIKNMELAATQEQAEQANQLKSEFLANMSHEIRTPMNGIIGMTNLLLDCDLNAVEHGYAQTVLHSADALLQIINDILDFSKIEAGKIDLENIAFDMQLLCEEVCEMMAIKAAEKRIELLLCYPLGTARYVVGDPGRVRQILFNLLNNAIKFTDNGHVILSLLSSLEAGGKIKIHAEVEDTGIGIRTDQMGYIFNKFTQADSSTSRKFGGTGLGLSICQELIHMMEGQISVRSDYGVGSTFSFDILMDEDKVAATAFVLPQSADLKGLKILVVDDNVTARIIARELLVPYGATIVEASGGQEALELLEKGIQIDVAILDFMMPAMDGAELGRKLKENPLTKTISMLMVTSAPNRGDKKRLEEIGFAGYLSKPLMADQLRDTLTVIYAAQKANKTIPFITQHSLKEAKAGLQEKTNKCAQYENVHVLLVEDNPVNQMVAVAMLEKYGCRVTPSGNGDEAVKQLKQRNFDLILMDCQMPVMDGYEATQIIRKLEEHQKRSRTPIVAFTAHALKGDDEKCFAVGMDDYIPKPLRQSDMDRVLIKWLPSGKRAHTQAEEDGNKQTPRDDNAVVDEEIFTAFSKLMEDKLVSILIQYFEISNCYLQTIKSSLEKLDFKAMHDAAHPLKSCSKQIGAFKLAEVAAQIEHQTSNPSPNPTFLKPLVAQLEMAFHDVTEALQARMTIRET